MIFFLWDCEQTSVNGFSSEKRKNVTLSTMHASVKPIDIGPKFQNKNSQNIRCRTTVMFFFSDKSLWLGFQQPVNTARFLLASLSQGRGETSLAARSSKEKRLYLQAKVFVLNLFFSLANFNLVIFDAHVSLRAHDVLGQTNRLIQPYRIVTLYFAVSNIYFCVRFCTVCMSLYLTLSHKSFLTLNGTSFQNKQTSKLCNVKRRPRLGTGK